MTEFLSRPSTAFAGSRRIASGPLSEVALAVKAAGEEASSSPILTFDDATGSIVDLDLRGGAEEIIERLKERAKQQSAIVEPRAAAKQEERSRSRGRPRLGVVAREVTLLPRHWEWLAAQPGGASQALRRLVDQARREDGGGRRRKAAQEAAYRFMSAMAGDLPGFEEATRALFADDATGFARNITQWPDDVADYARLLAADALTEESIRL